MPLLPRQPRVIRQRQIKVSPKRIDIQTAATGVARINGKAFRLAFTHHIQKYLFNALLMKPGMFAIRNDLPQQSRVIDWRADITNLHASPIRLPGHRTIRFQQVRKQRFINRRFAKRRAQ